VTQVTDPASGQWTTAFNASGYPTSSTNPASETVTRTFDGAGRLTGFTDALSRSVSFTLNPLSRLTALSGPSSSGYSLTRNGANLVTALLPSSGGQHSWTYDNACATATGTDLAGATESVIRDGNSNPTQITDRKGQKTVITYTTGDRVSQIVYKRADGTTESTVTYSYDPTTDLLASISDTAGPGYSLQYNYLDEVTYITGPEGTTTLGYDNLGRLTSATVPGQAAITYGYDTYGRLSTLTKGSQTLTYSYDSTTGRVSSITRPNGIVTKYFYDSLWRVNRIEQWLGQTQLEYENYTFDAGHRITSRNRNGTTSTFGYSTLDQLTSSTVPNQTVTLIYDVAGNRTSQTVNSTPKTLVYNTANRLTSDGGASVVHDANGSITQDGSTTYSWDVRGRLTQVVSGSITLQFTYDCFNRRVTKTTNGVTKRYVWLGSDLAVEADSSWNVLASYFYQPGVDAPISRTDNSGSTVYYLADDAGSVTALANSTGSVLGRYYYSPWGEVVSQDSGLPTQPLKWTGRELDETGLYYLRGRYYSPTLGRFLSEDPAGLGANLNLYLFGLDNPMGCRDPFGLCGSNGGSSDYDPTAGGFSFGPPGHPWFSFDGESANTAGKQLCGVGDGFTSGLCFGWKPSANAGVYDPNSAAGMAANAAGEFGAAVLQAGLGEPPPGGGPCFPADTPISTVSGNKPIKAIRPGDVVLSADPGSGERSCQRVLRTFTHRATVLMTITTESGRRIEATPNHPFWVEGRGFVPAGSLRRGDLLRDAYGRDDPVWSFVVRRGDFVVYNFEVARTHTYFASGVWVHNTCPNVAGTPGPGVTDAHLAGAQVLADETGAPIVIMGSRQTGFSYHTGLPYDPATDLDIGVVGEPGDFHNVSAGNWGGVPDCKDGPIALFPSVGEAVGRGHCVVLPQ
jgi:RHS repeat-associated protein